MTSFITVRQNDVIVAPCIDRGNRICWLIGYSHMLRPAAAAESNSVVMVTQASRRGHSTDSVPSIFIHSFIHLNQATWTNKHTDTT